MQHSNFKHKKTCISAPFSCIGAAAILITKAKKLTEHDFKLLGKNSIFNSVVLKVMELRGVKYNAYQITVQTVN